MAIMDYWEGRMLDPDSGRHTEEAVLGYSDYISRITVSRLVGT